VRLHDQGNDCRVIGAISQASKAELRKHLGPNKFANTIFASCRASMALFEMISSGNKPAVLDLFRHLLSPEKAPKRQITSANSLTLSVY
jgi:hypothetical protein